MKTNADFYEEDKLASKEIMGNDPGDEMDEEEANELLQLQEDLLGIADEEGNSVEEDDYDDEPDQP